MPAKRNLPRLPNFANLRDLWNQEREGDGKIADLSATDDHVYRFVLESTMYPRSAANYGCLRPDADTAEDIAGYLGLPVPDVRKSLQHLEDARVITRFWDTRWGRQKVENTLIWRWIRHKNPGREDIPGRPSVIGST